MRLAPQDSAYDPLALAHAEEGEWCDARMVAALWPKAVGKMAKSTGSGYLSLYRVSVESVSIEVRYAARIDLRIIPIQW